MPARHSTSGSNNDRARLPTTAGWHNKSLVMDRPESTSTVLEDTPSYDPYSHTFSVHYHLGYIYNSAVFWFRAYDGKDGVHSTFGSDSLARVQNVFSLSASLTPGRVRRGILHVLMVALVRGRMTE